MALTLNTQKSFKPNKRDVKYLSKDFSQFQAALVQYAQTYFPQTYRDFNATSPGMMFIEMASYVGDILSYYIDYQFKESLMVYAEERKNIMSLARYLGYKVRASTPATTELEVFQILPSIQSGDGTMQPDYKYALNILEGMGAANSTGVTFRTLAPVDFSVNTQTDPTEVTVFQRDNSNQPQFFLLRKMVPASSGKVVTKQFTVGTAEEFFRVEFPETNVLQIIDVRDSDNNKWYEVDYLAQDLILIDSENISLNDQEFSKYKDAVPSIMKSLRTSRRYTVNTTPDNLTYLEFGAGVDSIDDEIIIPDLNTVGRGLTAQLRQGASYDPSNFLKSKTYGLAPSNTVLSVTYVVGGGIESNVNSNELTVVQRIEFGGDTSDYSPTQLELVNTIRRSVKVNNYIPAIGGKGSEADEEIRQNALSNFAAQNRAVTDNDYVLRAYAMSMKFGSIAKAHVVQDGELDVTSVPNAIMPFGFNNTFKEANNPFAINLYVLSYDANKKLTYANEVIINNLRTYLNQYRMLTDGINIINGFIINISVGFEIITYKNVNKKEVLANCLSTAQDFFNIDNWTFSQPINLSNFELELAKVEGVQSVASVTVNNLTTKDGDYSPFGYDIEKATVNKIIYPSLDPAVFEVKFPSIDIRGSCL